MGRGRILALYSDTSGIDRYIFPNLEKRGWQIKQVNVTYPQFNKCFHLARTFHPDIKKWGERFVNETAYFLKSPEGFRKRTEFCEKLQRETHSKQGMAKRESGQTL